MAKFVRKDNPGLVIEATEIESVDNDLSRIRLVNHNEFSVSNEIISTVKPTDFYTENGIIDCVEMDTKWAEIV